MPNRIDDPIISTLREYERDPDKNGKKAILLTPQGGYFLFGNRFCGIEEYELELSDAHCRIQGKGVRDPIFFRLRKNSLCVIGKQMYSPDLVSLIFHISLGEDEPLRGILLALGREARLALFNNGETEELYQLSRRAIPNTVPQIPPDGKLQQYAENLRKNDLHWLTSLYLQGQQLKDFPAFRSGRET